MFRLRAKRTIGSSPPAELLFGEIAFSDANKRLYVGRADGSPCTFESDLSLSPITDAIATLTTDVATLDSSQVAQDTAIAAIEVEQGTQNDAIALLNAATDSQADAIGLLATTTSVQNDAIAALTTEVATLDSTTGEQATAIAALTTSDVDQDTAIAALAASDAAQATAIALLQARPVGFTYDQQAEPSGPAAGATWRERSAGGLIVGEWEWTGSVWAALQKTTLSGVVANGAATAYPTLYFEAPRCLFVQCRVVINPVGNPATPFNSSNYREVYLGRGATGAGSSVFGFRPLLSLAQGDYSSPMNYFNPSGAPFFTQTAVAGSPGTMNAPGVSWVYREVRA